MKTKETVLSQSAALAEKRARSAGKKAKKSTNECAPKRRRGGQSGNTNAMKHGRRSRAYLEARQQLRMRLREARALLKLGRALKVDSETEDQLVAYLMRQQSELGRLPP